jgi:hypothetical protein
MSKKIKFVLYGLNCLFLFSIIFYGQEQDRDGFFKPTDNKLVISNRNKSSADLLNDSLKISFEVTLAKRDFLLLEPVILKCRFSNQTDDVLEIYEPNLVNQLGMKSVVNERVDVDRRLFSHYINRPNRARKLEPGGFVEEVIILEPGAGLFKSTGKYDVQFFISFGDQKMWSNSVNVVVREPVGIDKEAYDFIAANLGSEYDLFSSSDSDVAVTKSLLEMFISRYGTSGYHHYAVLRLSTLYSVSKQFEKAKNELLKFKNTQNKLMNTLVERRLADLADSPS